MAALAAVTALLELPEGASTTAGERFLVRCRHLLEERDDALTAMLDESPQLQGHLRMICSERFVVR